MAILLLPVYTRYLAPNAYGVVELLANDGDPRQHPRPVRDHRGVPALLLHRRGRGAPGRARATRHAVPPGHDHDRGAGPRRRRVAALESRARPPDSPSRAGVPDRRPRAVVVHEPRARLWPVARRGAAAHVRDRVADQRRAHDRRVGRARRRVQAGRVRAAARQLRRRARWCCSGCGGRCAAAWSRAGRGGEQLSVLLRFGLPTVPAEASVYALSIVDRYYICTTSAVRRPRAGTRSRSSSPARSRSSCARSSTHGRRSPTRSPTMRRRRVCTASSPPITCSSRGWVVAGLALEGRWILRLLTTPRLLRGLSGDPVGVARLGDVRAVGRAAGDRRAREGDSQRNFPAALAGLVTNVVLLLVLVPPLGIAGAGIALCGAYVAMLGVMHLLIRRAFAASFEWRRLAQLVVVIGGLAVAGDLLLPTHGFVGFLTRAAGVRGDSRWRCWRAASPTPRSSRGRGRCSAGRARKWPRLEPSTRVGGGAVRGRCARRRAGDRLAPLAERE